MSYVILKKPYIPGDELTSWEPIQFVRTFNAALKIVKQHKFKFNRGDMILILVAKDVSAIEANAYWLWIALDSVQLERCPQRSEEIEESDFNWIDLYQNTTDYGVVTFLDNRHLISRGYIVAISYEWLSLIQGSSLVDRYTRIIKKWTAQELSTYDIGVLAKTLKNSITDSFERESVYSCLLGITMTSMNPASNLGITMAKISAVLGERDGLNRILHEMIPLQEFLLVITESRKLKLLWE